MNIAATKRDTWGHSGVCTVRASTELRADPGPGSRSDTLCQVQPLGSPCPENLSLLGNTAQLPSLRTVTLGTVAGMPHMQAGTNLMTEPSSQQWKLHHPLARDHSQGPEAYTQDQSPGARVWARSPWKAQGPPWNEVHTQHRPGHMLQLSLSVSMTQT